MKILVAGGAGYIGARLVPRLLELGHQVEVYDRLWFGCALPPGTRVIARDLFECQPADLERFDQVIFLAGLSNDPMAELSPAQNFISNGALPSYLAFVAKQAKVRRFLYASSCSVYGFTSNASFDEHAPVTCRYPYGISKLQGERGVLQLQDEAFSPIALRQGTVCGHSPRMRFDLIVNTMYKTALSEGRIVVSNPSIWRPVLAIRDAVRAFVAAVEAPPERSGVFNVASGNYTVLEVATQVGDALFALTGTRVPIETQRVPDARNYRVSLDRARDELGFEPRCTIRDIVAELHENRASYGDFAKDEYYNIRVFRTLLARGSGRDRTDAPGERSSP